MKSKHAVKSAKRTTIKKVLSFFVNILYMTETVEAIWNYDLEAGKEQGVVLLVGFNSDGSKGIGYGLWDDKDNAWWSFDTLQPMPNFTPKAWLKDGTLIPKNMVP